MNLHLSLQEWQELGSGCEEDYKESEEGYEENERSQE
jgi:hypothetical protein